MLSLKVENRGLHDGGEMTSELSEELSEITVAEAPTMPDLDRASSLLIGGKWTAITSAADQGDGWVTVKMSGFMALNVRASSIEAVRFFDLPRRPPQVPMAFDLGAS